MRRNPKRSRKAPLKDCRRHRLRCRCCKCHCTHDRARQEARVVREAEGEAIELQASLDPEVLELEAIRAFGVDLSEREYHALYG